MRKNRQSNVELAFHSCAQSNADSRNQEISASSFFLPSLVAKLGENEKAEVRLSAIRSLTDAFTKHCAHARDDRMSDAALASLREIILNKNSRSEHNEALRLVCALSLGRRSEFSARAQMLIQDLLPSIGFLASEYDGYRAFAISILAANSIEGRENSLDIFKAFLDAFINATTTTIKNSKNQNKPNNRSKRNNINLADNNIKNDNADTKNGSTVDEIDEISKQDNSNNTVNKNDNYVRVSTITNDTQINTNDNDDNNNNDDDNDNNNDDNDNNNNDDDNNNDNNKNNDNENSISDAKQNENKHLVNINIDASNFSEPNHADLNIHAEIPDNSNSIDKEQRIEINNNDTQSTTNDSSFSLKKRTKYRGSTQSLRELLQGATLIASSLPAEAAAEDLIDELTTVINICIGTEDDKDNSTIDPLLATDALDLFLVVYECIVERREELHLSQDENQLSSTIWKARDFISHFRPNIETLVSRVNFTSGNKGKNKAKDKSLRSKIADVLRCVDGCSKRSMDLAFNEQHVSIEGARKVVIAEAVKRVTQKNFLSHLQANPALQNDLGFSLVSSQSAVKLIRRFKPEIKQERVLSKKEREIDRMKRRKMKEEKSKDFDE